MSKTVSKEFALRYLKLIPFNCNSCRALRFDNCDTKQEQNFTCVKVYNKLIDLIELSSKEESV